MTIRVKNIAGGWDKYVDYEARIEPSGALVLIHESATTMGPRDPESPTIVYGPNGWSIMYEEAE